MKYPCVEATLDVEVGFRVVRLWLDVGKEIPSAVWGSFDITTIETIRRLMAEIPDNRELLEELVKIPKLNAVQLLLKTSSYATNGMVVYLVPFEDVHG